ncbi:ATP-grasp domain-containing protein [Streptomyces sp. MP131-18]|uniref:carboxylate--amine ligase n=1 Tax=Streptomyces sp. MP131-18 TaxID=1857892 RepID=UPI00097C72F0|nr:ATP-grasp domain-containing protein [Streptomyces sp. MP131-18]ONK12851.1 putative ATP-grasp enzyme [Streptomyces sp. MP131-18]
MSPSPLDAGVPALLLRLDRNPFHHGSLGAVRSLGRAGVEVHAFVEGARSPLVRSRYLWRGHVFRGDACSAAEVERALLRVAGRIGRPAVLIPMDDLGAITAARLAGRLRGRYLLPRGPAAPAERAADKAELAALCGRLGLAHPRTAVPDSAADAVAAVRRLGLPAVAKWSRPWLLPPGGALRSTTVVTGAGQVRRLFACAGRAGSRLLLQRLVPGGRGADWFFHGCFAADGRLLAGGTGRKDLSWPVGAGLTAVGSRLPHPAVARAALRFADHLGYHGVLDLDFRVDAGSGVPYLLDFNPRPGAQFRLFEGPDGLDVVRALHLDLTGRAVPAAPRAPGRGRVFVAENYGLLAALAAGRRWRRGGREVEWAWFAADDPAPFFAMAGGWLRRGPLRARAEDGNANGNRNGDGTTGETGVTEAKDVARCMTW